MEKLYSKSIFSLSSFLAHSPPLISLESANSITSLSNTLANTNISSPPTDYISPTNTNPNISSNVNSNLNPNFTPSLRCNACSITFEDAKDQHAHYKSQWHTFNLKLRLAGATAITKEEFDALGEVSGSSGESSSSESDSEDSDGKLHQFLKKEKAAAQSAGDDNKPRKAKTHKLAFLAQDGANQVVISVWRCLLEEDAVDNGTRALSLLRTTAANTKWTILLCSGGRFAGAVFVGNNCVEHKAMHRYTVRKKQGGSQSSRDATGNAPKSAGASLRRYNETRLREDIAEILQSWKEHITTSHYIFYFAPKGAPRSMLIFEGSPVQAKDPKVRKIPVPVKRPTFLETKYVHQSLSTIEFFKKPEEPIPAPAPTTQSPEQTATSTKKEKIVPKPDPPIPKKEDPIYAPIRAGNLEEIQKLLETDKEYQLSVPESGDDVITPLFVACTIKNTPIITYLLNHPITREEINVSIPSHKFYTPLHFVSSEGDIELVKLLLEAGANPTLKDINSKTAHDVAKNKETRLAMRTFAGKHLDKWDYTLAHIEPLTEADKKEQQKKKAEKLKKKKQAQKQKKEIECKEQEKAEALEKQKQQAEELKKIEKEAKQMHDTKVKTMSDREKRAMAAEKRLLASKGILSNCENCKNEIVGVPFERLEFKYCTTKCVAEHKKIIGR